jgi:hypothetical protein
VTGHKLLEYSGLTEAKGGSFGQKMFGTAVHSAKNGKRHVMMPPFTRQTFEVVHRTISNVCFNSTTWYVLCYVLGSVINFLK